MAIEINLSTLRQQVQEGWKKTKLAEHYELPVAQMTQVLKQAGLKIRKFHAPKFILVDDSLEEATEALDDEFLKKGLMLVVDGTDPELVRNLLETELDFIEQRHKAGQGLFESMATAAPGFGMIGTLIGLINMLGSLDDPTTIGPSMAVALITTLYGSLIANLFFSPMANKLKVKSGEEILEREIMVEGLLSIQAGENPRIIEEKLKAFLPPSMRVGIGTGNGGEE